MISEYPILELVLADNGGFNFEVEENPKGVVFKLDAAGLARVREVFSGDLMIGDPKIMPLLHALNEAVEEFTAANGLKMVPAQPGIVAFTDGMGSLWISGAQGMEEDFRRLLHDGEVQFDHVDMNAGAGPATVN